MKIIKLFIFLYLLLILPYKSNANVLWEKVNLPKPYITNVQNTHFGVIAGEFDSRAFLNPYNGVVITKDFGDTWRELGLAKRGITDIFYNKEDRSIYASTYYSVFDTTLQKSTIGLYISFDKGNTWQHFGPDVSTTKVLAFDKTVLLGTYSHGLWYSNDNGKTWTQKIGSGYFGPRIKMLKQVGDTIYTYDDLTTYKSIDGGKSWEVLQAFGEEKIADVEGTSAVILAGTSNGKGLFYSHDNGKTWAKDSFWDGKSIHSIKYFPINKYFYLGTSIGVWFSSDNGKTWLNTNAPFNKQTLGISWVFSTNSKLFASVQQDGLYKFNVASYTNNTKQYFSFPWHQTFTNEALDSISSFFDHKYPLLGYRYYSEPSEDATTIVNFYGLNLSPPKLYYSSHDGIDFALKYGTEITAVCDGVAEYGYDKGGLGYFVKLTHTNGYQTIYGHLQEHSDDPIVNVFEGDVIGKVGMSGNTSGPHLHFTVIRDLDNDGDFSDDIPQGKTDPFGWQNILFSDPWNNYTWEDSLGKHTTGSNSYLWKNPVYAKQLYSDGTKFNTEILGASINFNDSDEVYTVVINNLPANFALLDNNNKAVSNRHFMFKYLDAFGDELDHNVALNVELSYEESLTKNIDIETLQVFGKNILDTNWQELPIVIDREQRKVFTNTDLQQIVLSGKLTDNLAPITTLKVYGNRIDGTYIELPIIELDAKDTDYQSNQLITFYRINDSEFFEYKSPFPLPLKENTTHYKLEYMTLDGVGNIEKLQSSQLDIDTLSIDKNRIRIINTGFNTIN